LFGIYLAWLGLPRLMRVRRGEAMPYVAISVGCAAVIVVAVTAIEAAFLT